MDTVVLKFGGSSLANNERLMMVANKIIEKAMKHKVVVVVSAQGKTTDNLLKQAKELEEITKSQNINKRELDMLLSTGEQVSASKLAILLNYLNIRYSIILLGLLSLAFMKVILDYMKTRFGLKSREYKKEDIKFILNK